MEGRRLRECRVKSGLIELTLTLLLMSLRKMNRQWYTKEIDDLGEWAGMVHIRGKTPVELRRSGLHLDAEMRDERAKSGRRRRKPETRVR
jgi:hypothetical protein